MKEEKIVNKENINALMKPKSVAILGASADTTKIGHTVVKNIIEGGYEGKIYPINLKEDEILGLKCYKTLLDVPGPIDACVVTIPAKFVLNEVETAGKKGVKGLIIITSGFSETGNKELEEAIVDKAREFGIRILGPNIVGTLSNAEKLNASFAPVLPYPGKGALVSQSGALLISMDMATFTRRVGFEKLISIGNMSDIDFADMLEWLDEDEHTSSISLYIEGIKDGRKFMDAARKVKKPIIALKAGSSAHGAAAAASHTGSLAGAAKVYSAAFQQAGVVQASDLGNLFDLSLALSMQPPMLGDNLLIITNGGGVGVLATDAAEKYNLPLKFAPKEMQEELKKHMPPFGSSKNPVDLTGMAGFEWYFGSIKNALPYKWVDGLAVLYCETAMTDPMEIAKSIKKAIDEANEPAKPVCVSFVGGVKSEEAMQWLVENGIPAYTAPDLAIHALSALREFALMKEIVHEDEETIDKDAKNKAVQIIKGARDDKRDALTEIEAKQVFAAYGLPVTATTLAKTEDEAVNMAKEVGYPIVMKIVSPEILHKSDAGGVKVNIKNEAECREAFKTIVKNAKAYNPDADLHGVAVQEMAPWGTEVILGSVNDSTFGPTIMFGLGGIFVEVLKDVTFRVAPVSKKSSLRMISEIRGAPILAGVRGEAPRDRLVLAETISRYSNMIVDLAEEISESDANPVLVYEEGKGLKVVDARIILKKK